MCKYKVRKHITCHVLAGLLHQPSAPSPTTGHTPLHPGPSPNWSRNPSGPPGQSWVPVLGVSVYAAVGEVSAVYKVSPYYIAIHLLIVWDSELLS